MSVAPDTLMTNKSNSDNSEGSVAPKNLFSPSFGTSPPLLAGRDEILDMFSEATETGPTHPAYTSILIGRRGAGKTVTLNALQDDVRRLGWLTVAVDTAAGPVTPQVTSKALELLEEYEGPPGARLTGLGLFGQRLELEQPPRSQPPSALREVLTRLADHLERNGVGLLITVDELQGMSRDDMRVFGSTLQHVTRREERPIAFVGAGLPSVEETLLADPGATFLQRCERFDVGRLPDRAVREALEVPVRNLGGTVDPEGLDRAVAAASGYAFMVQLIGFHMWRSASDPTRLISAADVDHGIAEATRRLGPLVIQPVWRDLPDMQRRFCVAMLDDEGPSRMADIASRLGKSSKYVSVYRDRLIKVGMIVPAGHGLVEFALPHTAEWLRSRPDL